MAVFGTSLTHTIVVTTRAAAVIVATKCKLLRLHGVSIEILEEMIDFIVTPPKIASEGPKYTVSNQETELNQQPSSYAASIVPLLDCVKILNYVASPAINRRLQNWLYFDGVGHQVIIRDFPLHP